MGKIALFLNNYNLGTLVMNEDEYLFTPNSNDVLHAQKDFPLLMRSYNLGHESLLEMDVIPEPFASFYGYSFRPDIEEKANISENDTMFERIYKIAGLDLETGGFTLRQV